MYNLNCNTPSGRVCRANINVGEMFENMATAKSGGSPDAGYKLLLIVCYFLAVGALIAANGFLPFITDNNETFSSLAHASNIYNFGFRGTYGLTDETISPFAAAGPYVYTHMGNFPRFFALLIYALGARTPEAQIIVTAATVGAGGFFLAFHFFSRRVGVAFAVVYCLLFVTDYLMVLQWQVVTWQVWRFLFLFLSLILVDRLRERPTVPLIGAALLNFACLNYYDIPFSVFVGTAAVIYGIAAPQSWRSRVRIICVVGAGFAIAAAVLITQSVFALGWDVFLADLRYTYLARNEMAPGAPGLRAVTEFYATNHIVFWMNFFDASVFRQPDKFIAALFTYVFSVYTPFTTGLALIVGGMTAIAAFGERPGMAAGNKDDSVVAVPVFLAAVAWCGVTSLFALDASIGEILTRGVFVGVAVAVILYDICFSDILYPSNDERTVPNRRLWIGAAWLFVVGCIFLASSVMYNERLKPLFAEIQSILGGTLVANLCLVLAIWVGVQILVSGVGRHAAGIRSLVRLLMAASIGYVVVILLSPGYVITTVMNRLTPLTVGFHLIFFALALFGAGYVLFGRWRQAPASVDARVKVAGSATILTFFIVAWSATQITYAVRLPGDTGSVFKALQADAFHGTSFIVDGYAAPVGVASQSWAYIDLALWHDRIKVGADGYRVENDKEYLWFRDRDTNPAYRRPQYFVCLIQRDVRYAVPGATYPGCATRELVAKARAGGNTLLAPTEVLRDPSPQDRWSVVKLNWTLPAYLRRNGPFEPYIRVVADPDGQKLRLNATFDLVQRDDRVSGFNYRLYRLDACASVVRALIGTSRGNDLAVESGADGVYQVGVELLPTQSQVAVEFFSLPLTLKGQKLQDCGRESPGRSFVFRRVSGGTN